MTLDWDSVRVAAPPAPSVLIVSDVLLYREGLASTLRSDGRLRAVGAVRTDAALVATSAWSPQVILLDVSASGALGLAKSARWVDPAPRVIGFAISTDAALIACAEAGLAGFVGSDGSVDEIVAAVDHALRGELVCSPRQVALLRDRLADLAGERSPAGALMTRRQREIARLVADGLSNKEIALDLRIGPATVKNHVHNILDKLGVKRRGAIAAHLARNPPPAPGTGLPHRSFASGEAETPDEAARGPGRRGPARGADCSP